MQVSVLQERLLAAAIAAKRTSATRSTLPILESLRLETVGGRLVVSSTDLEAATKVRIGAQVDEDGALQVNAKSFLETVKSFGKVKLDITGIGRKTTITDGQKTVELVCQYIPDDFPPIPEVESEQCAEVNAQAFKSAIDRVIHAAARDDSRPVLCAVNIQCDDGVMTLVTADGFRLALVKVECTGGIAECNVDAQNLRRVSQAIGRSEDTVRIEHNAKHIVFRLYNLDVIAYLTQATFPNYAQLIPTDNDCTITVGVGALRSALKSAKPIADQGSGIIRLRTGNNDLIIGASMDEVGDYVDRLPADIIPVADIHKIAFNVDYMVDILGKSSDEETVNIGIKSPSSPGLFRITGDDDYLEVCMPMSVQWDSPSDPTAPNYRRIGDPKPEAEGEAAAVEVEVESIESIVEETTVEEHADAECGVEPIVEEETPIMPKPNKAETQSDIADACKVLLEHADAEFASLWRKLGHEHGYRNLGRALARAA